MNCLNQNNLLFMVIYLIALQLAGLSANAASCSLSSVNSDTELLRDLEKHGFALPTALRFEGSSFYIDVDAFEKDFYDLELSRVEPSNPESFPNNFLDKRSEGKAYLLKPKVGELVRDYSSASESFLVNSYMSFQQNYREMIPQSMGLAFNKETGRWLYVLPFRKDNFWFLMSFAPNEEVSHPLEYRVVNQRKGGGYQVKKLINWIGNRGRKGSFEVLEDAHFGEGLAQRRVGFERIKDVPLDMSLNYVLFFPEAEKRKHQDWIFEKGLTHLKVKHQPEIVSGIAWYEIAPNLYSLELKALGIEAFEAWWIESPLDAMGHNASSYNEKDLKNLEPDTLLGNEVGKEGQIERLTDILKFGQSELRTSQSLQSKLLSEVSGIANQKVWQDFLKLVQETPLPKKEEDLREFRANNKQLWYQVKDMFLNHLDTLDRLRTDIQKLLPALKKLLEKSEQSSLPEELNESSQLFLKRKTLLVQHIERWESVDLDQRIHITEGVFDRLSDFFDGGQLLDFKTEMLKFLKIHELKENRE